MSYDIPRDRWGRPLITPADGGKPIGYTRATTFAGLLDDGTGLTKWKLRQTAAGLATRPDLIMAIKGSGGDRRVVDDAIERAMAAAGAGISATVGTALHGLTEQADAGVLDLSSVPSEYRADIEAYTEATRGIVWIDVERFGVVDALATAGTWDRAGAAKGAIRIYDLKTGQSMEHGLQRIAMQLAIYSRATPYTVAEDGAPLRGRPNPERGIDQKTATIVWAPAGQGRCELIDIDIAAGWDACWMAADVKRWRAAKVRI